ncbi:large conductance mechanosensitive channel protein MscL [Deinococcus maricopensis]|uniref:Large-conductance mechanosensitive channel n=1 Tax=Deinococcus maricopensis (strain DSM 21211 / LMG 22137 / NRRL B-23946 / LB-34) TaxID=709986 RepID=E8U3K4_DEIML|nr:large conductance mechanosensitive channel protein MscL [Deinococcus maricopensis]ADV68628.1 large conductance mechanosensitive channel protein [Deinococcus maricopensis DSM 21211]
MIQGFRNFILRGNVVDLAVGVVIGAAFNGLVTAFTRAFLDPIIKLVTGGVNFGGRLILAGSGPNAITIEYGAFLTALITFLLTAVVVYVFVVTPMNRLSERFKQADKPAKAEPSNQEKLLAEIRDLLRERR